MNILTFYLIFLCLSAYSIGVLGKDCNNIPSHFLSPKLRYELMTTKNETWKKEVLEYYHLDPDDESTWMELLPPPVEVFSADPREEFEWAMLYRSMKNPGWSAMPGGRPDFLKEVSLHDVRLDPSSKHGQAQQTNLEYLLMLEVDNLVWSFRRTAGLPTPGKAYGGWEAPDCELRGHFVGHYMSATAKMWASTRNDTLHKTMFAVVSALHECQEKMGTGYLSAFPSEEFDRFEAIRPVWAPYYTIHKIMAGLLDQHLVAGNPLALEMVVKMADYFSMRVQNVITKHTIERHWASLNNEVGGMNDILYKLYTVTENKKYLALAHLFDKPCFLGMLAVQADSLSDFHANTHIPLVIGSQMRYEVTGDPLYKIIGTYFLDIVNSSHAYATGGSTLNEHWSDPKRLVDTLELENEESCTTYNILKVSRHLFTWTKGMSYADYYERTLTNGVLSIQRGTEPGVMIYMLPQGRGVSKAKSHRHWGTKFDSFWCCYGTGVESFSKLGDSIYFEEESDAPGLYIIQFISSSFNWRSAQSTLSQRVEPVVSSDPHLRVSLEISPNEASSPTLNIHLRIPFWTHSDGATAVLNGAALNGQSLPLTPPATYLSITRKWSQKDTLELQLPIDLRTEAIKDDRPEYASVKAILFGPYLLVGLTHGDWDLKSGGAKSLSDWITPIPPYYNSQLITLSQQVGNTTMVFSNSGDSIKMENQPAPGTDAAVEATFRLVPTDASSANFSSWKDLIGKNVMLEPFDLPGMAATHQGPCKDVIVTTPTGESDSSDIDLQCVFRLLAGLDGNPGTVSLEAENQKGCFVYGGVDYKSEEGVRLRCQSRVRGISDTDFRKGASFTPIGGASEYDPISFAAKGAKRNFLLQPLMNLRDESYTAYFNIMD